MLLAAVLLRRGDSIIEVAARTRVPLALLEMVREELDSNGEAPRAQIPQPARFGSSRRTRRKLGALVIVVTALANITACVTALLWHNPTLGMLTGIVAIALVVAVTVLGRT